MLIAGSLILTLASFLQSYTAVGIKMSKMSQPEFIYKYTSLFIASWLGLFILGIVFVYIANWILGMIATFIF